MTITAMVRQSTMKHANNRLAIVSAFHMIRSIVYTETFGIPHLFTAFLGWSSWSEWTPCNEDGEKVRYRKCLTTSPDTRQCQGDERETRDCLSTMSNGKGVLISRESSSYDTNVALFIRRSYGAKGQHGQSLYIPLLCLRHFTGRLQYFHLYAHEEACIAARHQKHRFTMLRLISESIFQSADARGTAQGQTPFIVQ